MRHPPPGRPRRLVYAHYPKRQDHRMKTFFATHGACFRAEWIKLKRTGLIWMGIGAALFIPLIQTIANFFVDPSMGPEVWNQFLQRNLSGFTSFFYPLFLCITMLRLVYLEHKSDTWKVLETQPVSRLALFLVKYEVAMLVAALSLGLLLLFGLGGGMLVQASREEMNFKAASINWGRHGAAAFRFWIASFGIVAIQYYLSLLIRNFGWPMIISLVAVIAAGILASLGVWPWFPWSATNLTGNAYNGSPRGGLLLPHEWLSILWALLFLTLGYQLLRRRGFMSAHIRGWRGLATGGALALFVGVVWLLSKPQIATRYSATVVAGRFETLKPLRSVALVRPPFNDTIAIEQLKEGRFHMHLPDSLATGFYEVQAGSNSVRVYLGAKDSLFVHVIESKQNADITFGGTRVAEADFLQRNQPPDFSYMTRFFSDNKPSTFGGQLLNGIASEHRDLKKYHTVDNMGVAPDFVNDYGRIIDIAGLRIIEIEYPKSFALYHPNDTLRFPKKVEEFRQRLRYDDPRLLGTPGYLDFVAELLQARTVRSANRDSAFRAESNRLLQNSELREALALNMARMRMRRINDTAERAAFVQVAFTEVDNPRYRRLLQQDLLQLNSLMRGRQAPNFAAEATNNNRFTLDQFRGRYVVLDVWATWCGPCRQESPFFEDLAEKYTDERLAFVALSVDEDRMAWLREARFKSARVLQLHVADALESFMKPYGVQTIPRFILIDPQGRIVNAFMPAPSDAEFASILQREIRFVSRY
ncbi:MAG: redoxin domain-containing protein [Chitinophagaceae bacterium]|nr:MAG: redoxin domain-containing protein [Chitinophagaceae bacterium]